MKVGDYCRTKDGFIAKLIGKDTWYKFDGVILEEEYTYNYLSKEHAEELIIKSSPNIIDLIEVGDYVNGYKVLEIEKDYLFDYREEINVLIVQNDEVYEVAKKLYSDDIKSIVTHEQFESMEYRIGE